MSNRPIFRRTYLIKRALQIRYIGIIFALALLASIVTGYTVFATGWTLLGEKLANVYPQGRLLSVFRVTNLTLIRNLLFVSPFIFILALLLSHRIAGPLYRVEKAIHEISKGVLPAKIKLRKGDDLVDLADAINVLIESLGSSITSRKEVALKIRKELDELKKAISSQPYDTKQIHSSINNLEAKINDLSASLDNQNIIS